MFTIADLEQLLLDSAIALTGIIEVHGRDVNGCHKIFLL